jgi:hypothetical protein
MKDASADVALLSQALHHAAIRRAPSTKPRAFFGLAAGYWYSTSGATRKFGCASDSAIAGLASKTPSWRGC